MEQEHIKDINEHNDNDNNICVNDVLDALVSKKWLGADLFLTPPDGNGSDEDSGDENEVPEFHHLSKKQLLASCEVQVVRCDEDEVRVITNKNELTQLESSMLTETDDSDTNSILEKIKENEIQMNLREEVSAFVSPRNSVIDTMDLDDHNWTHVRLFELFFYDELLDSIAEMTNTYAIEQSAVGWTNVDKIILRAFFAILILSGYNQLPSYKMYWEEASDVQNLLVRDAMPRNRFSHILRYIHFCDNGNFKQDDKCSKVRPLLDMCRERCKKFAILTNSLNVDESMIPYFGKFSQRLKQRMPTKPIRSGYKVWCLNLKGGYLYDFEIYQGKGSKNHYSAEFGVGPSVVLGLLDSLPDGNYGIFIDNYFNSIPLMKHLSKIGIGCTGTMKANMFLEIMLNWFWTFKRTGWKRLIWWEKAPLQLTLQDFRSCRNCVESIMLENEFSIPLYSVRSGEFSKGTLWQPRLAFFSEFT